MSNADRNYLLATAHTLRDDVGPGYARLVLLSCRRILLRLMQPKHLMLLLRFWPKYRPAVSFEGRSINPGL